MKILMVTMGLEIGGAETHIVELCRALTDMGHDITVASNGGVYETELTEKGIAHVKLPLNTKRPTAMLKSYLGLKKLISDGGFDIVHAHARIPAFLCSLVRRSVDFRFTTTAHLDFKVNGILRRLSAWGEKTLAVSEDIRDYLVKSYGIDRSNINLTINGIDADKFSPETDPSSVADEFGLSAGSTKIVYISRLDPDRSRVAYHLISAAEKLASPDGEAKYGKTEYVIVGDGGDYNELSALADEANRKIGRRAIVMTGARTDINKLCALADVFVAVSRSALEAMSSGKAVIVAGNQGYMGIFDESKLASGIETNFCCRGSAEPTEKALLADLSALLSMTANERSRMGEYNRSVVKQHYSVSRMANDYLDLYASLPPYSDFRYADVILSGYYGFDNMGDDSLLVTIADNIITERQGVKVAALTNNPKAMTEKTGIRCISRTNYFTIRNQLRHAKLLISGGGTLIQDGTSAKSLHYYLGIMRLAKRCGAKVYIYANGAGPLYRESSRRASAKVVNEAALITVREPDAKKTLVSIGVPDGRIAVTADPAFMIKPTGDAAEITARIGLEDGRRYYAVSLRECMGKAAKEIDEDELVSKVAALCQGIKKCHGLEPVFILMQPSHDREICASVREKLGFGIIAPTLTAGELCTLLGTMKFVVGMRLHTLIFASHMAVPMIALSYDPKINGLMNYIGQRTLFRAQDFDVPAVLDAVSGVLADRDEITWTLGEKSAHLSRLAETDVENAVSLLS